MKNSDNYKNPDLFLSCLFVMAFIVFRLCSIGALNFLTGGKELASDVVFHDFIINNPLGILNGTAQHIASYPPFQWLIEWSLFNSYAQFFSKMVSYRLMMVTIELAAFVTLILVCRKSGFLKAIAFTVLFLFIISPHQSFASVFFVQEDVIAQLFMLIALLFLLYEKRSHCIVTLVLGVLIAKLFFVIPLFYVILFQGGRQFLKRIVDGVLALIPLVAVYALTISQALSNGGDVPIRDFTPEGVYASNYWVLLINSNPELLGFFKNASVILSLIVQLCLIAIFVFLDRRKNTFWHPVVLLVVPLAFFFGTFYQHMPEYLLMLWPLAALFCTTVWQQVMFASMLSIAWVPRIFHGFTTVIEGFGTAAESRSEIVGPLVELLNVDFYFLNTVSLIVQSVIYTVWLVWLCVLSRALQQRYQAV